MRSSPVKYGTRFGCRWGMPHDFVTLQDTRRYKIEKCKLCSERKLYNKGYRFRIDNVVYLKDHVRNHAQPNGSTKRVYAKVYEPHKLVIHL